MSAFAKTQDADQANRLSSELGRVFELRNRLAHFKDEDTPVACQLTHEEFSAQFHQFPDPELIGQLKPPSITLSSDAILSGINWLKEINRQYFRTEFLVPGSE